LGQRYVTELCGKNYDEDNLVNTKENNNSKRLKFNPQVLVTTVYDDKSQYDDKYNIETIYSKVSVHPSVNSSTD